MPAAVTDYLDVARIEARRAHKIYRRVAEYDDLYQVACLGVARAVETHDPAKGASLRSWAVTCARSECWTYVQTPLARLGRGKRAVSLSDAALARLSDDRPTAPQRAEQAETMARVREAMERLPRRQRQAVDAILDGDSLAQSGRRRGLSRQSVAQSGRLAIRRLRELLKVA